MDLQPSPAIADAARHPVTSAPKRARRRPGGWDYFAYLVVLPLVIASWLTALGIRPRAELGTWQAYIYIATRVLLAWWAAHAGAVAAGRLFAKQCRSLWRVQLAGFLLIWFPVTLLFHLHVHVFSLFSPDAARNLALHEIVPTLEYLVRLVSRSVVFFLPLWMAVAHAYRKQFGVDWYVKPQVPAAESSVAAAPEPPVAAPPEPGVAAAPGTPVAALSEPSVAAPFGRAAPPSFLAHTRLPPDTVIHTLSAAEHYIEVVCEAGKDLVRYRFTDAVHEMTALGLGCQVHRSWWVAWNAVAGVEPHGRAIEVILRDGRRVPVSLTYKNAFLSRYAQRRSDRTDAA
jgi:hypothetical protein